MGRERAMMGMILRFEMDYKCYDTAELPRIILFEFCQMKTIIIIWHWFDCCIESFQSRPRICSLGIDCG